MSDATRFASTSLRVVQQQKLLQMKQTQILVRCQDVTHVVSIPGSFSEKASTSSFTLCLRKIISHRTGWPLQYLHVLSERLKNEGLPLFATIRIQSSIRGGKGGFGTLLKGQSRQAGAKLTTDFGACRDLQGRRLRHVNDEIKLRKWREMERRKRENGDQNVSDDSLWNTPSGLYNWHLMTPTWADISKKATYKIKRQFQQLERENQKSHLAKQEQEQAYQRSVKHYVDKTTTAVETIQKSIPDAIRQGLEASKKRKRQQQQQQQQQQSTTMATAKDDEENGKPNALCALSGDVVVVYDKTNLPPATKGKKNAPHGTMPVIQIQSKSDFATVALVLDRTIKGNQILYYEVKLVSGGLAQVGWASLLSPSGDKNSSNAKQNEKSALTPAFTPNNDLGDGVGDDAASFGFDGSRGLKFHGGSEEPYGGAAMWKAGDILGCKFHVSSGSISYSLNGTDFGTAFTVNSYRILFPAFSCNQGEVLQLHLKKEECHFFPPEAVAVQDFVVVAADADSSPPSSSNRSLSEDNECIRKKSSKQGTKTEMEVQKQEATTKLSPPKVTKIPTETLSKKEPVKVVPLDLEKFNSAKELEELGLDRLKGASMALGIKCGGSLSERANRLFSLKGKERKDYPIKVRAKGFIV